MNDQSKCIKFQPARKKDDWTFTIVYVVGFLAIGVMMAADASVIADMLASGYSRHVSWGLAGGMILYAEIAWFSLAFSARNLCAFQQLEKPSLIFYFLVFILSGVSAFYTRSLIVNHIDALGSRNRKILNPVDYSRNPVLLAADREVQELSAQLASLDATTKDVARGAAQASMLSAQFVSFARDTTLSTQLRRDQLWQASRAGKSVHAATSSLTKFEAQRAKLLDALERARGYRKNLTDSLASIFSGRSAEDVIEAQMGVNLKAGLASMTQYAQPVIIIVLMLLGAAKTGVLKFYPIAFTAAHGPSAVSRPTINASASQSPSPGSPVASIIPAMHPDETRSQYVRRLADMWLKKEFPPYISQAFLAAQLVPKMSAPRFCKIVAERKRKLMAMPN